MAENGNNGNKKLIRGFIFATTRRTEDKSLNRLIFRTDRVYGPIVIRMRRGDLFFK
ncbi:MAG: hypothetical protein PWQ22_657 [Archaeoglobaceae archaeon]|nr:hypothetical protein [Archaeoglobaceae archaeon]MDK2876247.1 hypothetical protein [Archaeoglobaceae archaeon]